MDAWLRPILTRKQATPLSTPSHEKPPSFNLEDKEETSSRYRSSSRLSLSFRNTPTNPPPSPSLSPSADDFPSFKQPQTPWIPCSSDQIVELLKAEVMNRSSTDPLPARYNPAILQVLEAYYDLQAQLESKGESIAVLKRSHGKDIGEFEVLARAWHEKEKDYQKEIKKLEVLLSKTDGGMESVSMARSHSVLHGSKKAADTIARGIGTIKARNETYHCQDTELSRGFEDASRTVQSLSMRDVASQQVESPDQIPGSSYDSGPYLRSSDRGLEPSGVSKFWEGKGKASELQTERLTRARLDAFEKQNVPQRATRNLGIRYEDTSTDSSSSSYDDNLSGMSNLLGLCTQEKSLPEIPAGLVDGRKQTTLDKFLGRKSNGSPAKISLDVSVPRQLSFSFQPGDDVDIFTRQEERDRVKRRTVDDHLDKKSTLSFSSKAGDQKAAQLSIPGPQPSPKPKPRPRPSLGKLTTGPRDLADLQDSDSVKRGSSNSSIVTAIRDNSGRNSVVGESKQAGRPRLDRNTGSSEAAVTAAVKAIAIANGKKSPKQSGLASEMQEDNGR